MQQGTEHNPRNEHSPEKTDFQEGTFSPALRDLTGEISSEERRTGRKASGTLEAIKESHYARMLGIGLLVSPLFAAEYQSVEDCKMPIAAAVQRLTDNAAVAETESSVIQLTRNEQEFEGRIGEVQVSGTLNEAGLVTDYKIGDYSVHLEVARSYDDAATHLVQLQAAIKEFQSNPAFSAYQEQAPQFKSHDAVHIEFTVAQNEVSHTYLVGKGFAAEIVEAPASASQEAYREAVSNLKEFESVVQKQVQDNLPDGYLPEADLRAARERLQERSAAVDEQMQSFIDKFKAIPDSRQEWIDYRNGFHKKRNELLNFFQHNRPDRVDQNYYRQKIDEMEKVLAGYESYLSLTPGESKFTTEESLSIAERLERNENVNERVRAVRAGYGVMSQQHRQQFENEWNRLVSSFGKDYGWERWDPNSLSAERYDSVISSLDDLLHRYEVGLELKDITRTSEIAEAYDTRRNEYKKLKATVEEANDAGSEFVLRRLSDDARLVEQRPLDEAGAVYRTEENGSSSITDRYKDGYYYSRTVVDEEQGKKQSQYFYQNGNEQYDIHYRKQNDSWRLHLQRYSREDGTARYLIDDATAKTVYYADDGSAMVSVYYNQNRTGNDRVRLVSRDGEGEIGLFSDERQKNTVKNTGEYLDLLAKELNTPARLHNYFEYFLQYTSDGTNDHWQRASATLQRTAGGKMLGDCDDYAFLAREILRRQGENAHVVYIPGHAICLWVEKDDSGKYHAHTIGTYGYDNNGVRYGGEPDGNKAKGYDSIREAVNAVFKKYETADTGLEQGTSVNVNDGNITILTIGGNGSRNYTTTSLSYLMQDVD